MSKTWGMISFILFCIGLVVAVIGGIVMPSNAIIAMILAVIGLIIGIIYVWKATDINILLLSTIALLAMSAALAPILGVGNMITSILLNFAALMAPVALIAAIRALLMIGLTK